MKECQHSAQTVSSVVLLVRRSNRPQRPQMCGHAHLLNTGMGSYFIFDIPSLSRLNVDPSQFWGSCSRAPSGRRFTDLIKSNDAVASARHRKSGTTLHSIFNDFLVFRQVSETGSAHHHDVFMTCNVTNVSSRPHNHKATDKRVQVSMSHENLSRRRFMYNSLHL